jgi:hypothetical protein
LPKAESASTDKRQLSTSWSTAATGLARQLLDLLEDTFQKHQMHREEIVRELELYGKARTDPRGQVDPQQTLE